MDAAIRYLPDLILFLVWILLWAGGGWLLAHNAFRLRPNEEALTGFAIGLVLEITLINLLAQLMPFSIAIWLSSVVVMAGGIGSLLLNRRRSWLPARPALVQGPVFLGLFVVLVAIQRGLAIFDDFAHLPTTSIIATGQIPPQFPLAAGVPLSYHYFLMVFAGQLMRLLPLDSWTALDISRGLSAALAIMLSAIWVRRLTRSRLAGFLGGLMMAFGSGARWLLLLLPTGLLVRGGQQLDLLGSGAASGSDLASALAGSWAVEGSGAIPFPFAFANGIYAPGIISMNGPNGLMWVVVTLLLLLTFNRWQNGFAAAATVLVVAATSLLEEVGVAITGLAWIVVTAAYLLRNKTWRLPASLRSWWVVVIFGNLIGLIQGGAWTEVLVNWVARLQGGAAPASYQTIGFDLIPAPSIVSSHLGVLWLHRPFQLLVALVELGPVLLVFPLLVIWGLKALRNQRWYEAVLVVVAVLSLGMLFVHFSGSTGVRNTSRLYIFIEILALFAVPLVWMWAAGRRDRVRGAAVGLLAAVLFGGISMFALAVPAVQKPVYSYFVTVLDDRMAWAYWNRLEPDALVFDPYPIRAPTLFGRLTNSSYTWYEYKPEWVALRDSPDPYRLNQAGYHYLYLDNFYWESIASQQQAFDVPCVEMIDELYDDEGNFRRLFDISACRK